MNEIQNSWEKLVILADDLGEWRELLEKAKEDGRDNSEIIWGDSTLKKVIKLTKELLQEFEKHLQSVNGTISEAEKKALRKIRIETKLTLNSFRKEHRK